MNVLLFYDFQCLQTGTGLEKGKVRVGQIYFQSIDDVQLVIANQNVVHETTPLALIIATIILRIKWQKHEDFMKIGIPCSKQKAGQIVCSAFTDFNVYPTSTSLIVMVPMGINSKL